MARQDILRTLLFVVFFSVGATALAVSILCDELLRYYVNRNLLRAAQESLGRLESLNADYDALLEQLQKDPDLVKRIAPATLGAEQADANTVYPKAAAEQLSAARRALTEDSGRKVTESAVPGWIIRCSRPARRIMLFLAGAFLVFISFIWFGPVEKESRQQ